MSQHLLANGKLVVRRLLSSGHVALLLFGHSLLLSCLCLLSFKYIPRAVLWQAQGREVSSDRKWLWALMPSLVSWVQVRAEICGVSAFNVCTFALEGNTTFTAAKGRACSPDLGNIFAPKRTVSMVGGSDYKSF